jgi:hypothetical protein
MNQTTYNTEVQNKRKGTHLAASNLKLKWGIDKCFTHLIMLVLRVCRIQKNIDQTKTILHITCFSCSNATLAISTSPLQS